MTGDKPGEIWWPQTIAEFWCGDFSKKSDEEIGADALFDIPVSSMELSTRVMNAAQADDIRTIRDVVSKSKAEWLRTPNIGKKAVKEINDVLSNYNLRLSER